jgi:hypothetical protein
MKKGFFIQANKKQILGAYLAKYAFEKTYKGSDPIPVTIMLVEDIPIFQKFSNSSFIRKAGTGDIRKIDGNDLQSFTLTRFMPPELMGFEGRAVVIDPDIFALKDISELYEMNLGSAHLAACRKKDAWDSSVMVLDCAKLTSWRVENWLDKLSNGEIDYDSIMTIKNEHNVLEIPRKWNNLDMLSEDTYMLHTTNRITQPWRTGLPIDFTRNPMPKYFGLIPREPIHKLLGKYKTTYQPHPDKKIENWFLSLVKDALADGAITKEQVQHEVNEGHVRKDIFEIVK